MDSVARQVGAGGLVLAPPVGIVISDVHAACRQRVRDTNEAGVRQILARAEAAPSLRWIVLAGDATELLQDGSPLIWIVEATAWLWEALAQLAARGVDVVILEGNHDVSRRGETITGLPHAVAEVLGTTAGPMLLRVCRRVTMAVGPRWYHCRHGDDLDPIWSNRWWTAYARSVVRLSGYAERWLSPNIDRWTTGHLHTNEERTERRAAAAWAQQSPEHYLVFGHTHRPGELATRPDATANIVNVGACVNGRADRLEVAADGSAWLIDGEGRLLLNQLENRWRER